ncbi:hypothetical protein SAMN05421852_10337 [Thermoflavimicrobium dichotomicum]|uniref:Uncharacterized protein n=1 Tax=Thermoflavimicrobium dichotomicum TaxID=46223 RepID=A0A1I3MFI3_9BACL|nr:hypothetical protein SAMN05421852_10337 [Thermoflavimicrobium dichotomicum]
MEEDDPYYLLKIDTIGPRHICLTADTKEVVESVGKWF